MMLVIIFEQIFLLYFDAGGRSLLIGDRFENCWLATSNSSLKTELLLNHEVSTTTKGKDIFDILDNFLRRMD